MDGAVNKVNGLLSLMLLLEVSCQGWFFFFRSYATQNHNKIAVTLCAGSPS